MRKDVLDSLLEIADIHADRLAHAIEELKPIMPVSGKTVSSLSYETSKPFEMFTSRFAKLQDILGAKIFQALLEFSGEDIFGKSMIDILNQLEKLNVVDRETWLKLRNTRDHLSHEYPDNPEAMASIFNEAFIQSADLLNCYIDVKKFAEDVR